MTNDAWCWRTCIGTTLMRALRGQAEGLQDAVGHWRRSTVPGSSYGVGRDPCSQTLSALVSSAKGACCCAQAHWVLRATATANAVPETTAPAPTTMTLAA